MQVKVVFLWGGDLCSDCTSCLFSVAPQPAAHGSIKPGERWVNPGSPGAGDIALYGRYIFALENNVDIANIVM